MSQMTQSKAGLPQPGLDAAREGRGFCGKVNAKTAIDTEAVLTDSTFLKVVEYGKRLVITGFYMYLSTVSDWVTAEFGYAENEDGSGAWTTLTPKFRIDTGAAVALSTPSQVILPVPIVVTRNDGESFSAQVQGNDAAAALTLAYSGWEETDVDEN